MRGRPTLRPLRFPVAESKKLRQARRESLTDCTNATLGTSHSQQRSSVVLAAVITRRWISPVGQLHSSPIRLITDPQCVVQHHPGTPEHPRQHRLLGRCRFDAIPIAHLHAHDCKDRL
jgi:hypothetical protein